MTYLVCLMFLCVVLGFVGVASNPSPFYGAVGLVVAAVGGCGVLMSFGWSFVALVLFLIYLGGMLVVFAYSVALSAEPHPETWGDYFVLYYILGYVIFIGGFVLMFGGYLDLRGSGVWGGGGWGYSFWVDFCGVVMLYSLGGPLLLLCGCGLMLVLFVVLELTRGLARGGLRALW